MEITCALLVVILAWASIKPAKGQSCSSFTYTQHPPIPLNCKPFSNDPSPTWQLRTDCVVERDTTATAAFEVHWIHRDSSGVEEDLGLPGISTYNQNIPFAQSNGPRVVGTPFSESMVGQYWCQVFLDGSPLPVYSDAFTVLRPEEYDSQIPVCPTSLVRDVGTNICNDEPPPPLPSAATTSSTSSSSTSSSSSQQPLQTSIISTSTRPTTSTLTNPTSPVVSSIPSASPPSTAGDTSQLGITSTTTISTPLQSSTTSSIVISTTLPSTTRTTPVVTSSHTSSITTLVQQTEPPTTISSFITASTEQPQVTTMTTSTTESPSSAVITTSTTTSYLPRQSELPTTINGGLTTATSSTVTPNQSSVTVIPEGREEMSEMSYLLITAIALIVILSIMIVLLLILAYMMKCGKRSKNRRRRKQTTGYLAQRKSSTSSTELLDTNNDTSSTFNTINYTSAVTPQHVTPSTSHNNFKQHLPHSYSIIDETSMGLGSAAVSTNNMRTSARSLNFQIKPPAILRSKSPSLNRSLHHLSQSLLPPGNKTGNDSSQVYPINNSTFQYSVLTNTPDIPDNRHSGDSQVFEVEVSRKENEQRDKSSVSKELLKTEPRTKKIAHKMRTKQMSDVTELESWENQLQDNPMYMKLPIGLRVINTL